MELDDLKYLIKNQDLPDHSAEQLTGYLQHESNSVLQKIRRSIRLELLFAIVFGIAGIAWMLTGNLLFYKVLAGIVVIFCAGFLFYVSRLQKQINNYQRSLTSVKNNMREIIRILEAFIKLYFQLTMMMLPLICITGFFTIDKDKALSLSTGGWMFYAAWFIGWSVLMYYFTRWYLKKLYGNYLHELKVQLKELEGGEEELGIRY